MSVNTFRLPYCNYCSKQKDCKIKFDANFNTMMFSALRNVTLPYGIELEINCFHFTPNKDAFKIRIKENGDIEPLGINQAN